MSTPLSLVQRFLLGVYDTVYYLGMPLARMSKRLRPGLKQRGVPDYWGRDGAPFDFWIHAASGGEAYLVWELLKLCKNDVRAVLATSCTEQGRQVLEEAAVWCNRNAPGLVFSPHYFPFDAPSLMRKALQQAKPKALVLLETELWPGLLGTCAHEGVPVVVVNGRLSRRSLAQYLLLRGFFRNAGPQGVLAVSDADARRFAALFGRHLPLSVGRMNNMKFDRFSKPEAPPYVDSPMAAVFKPGASLCVLGSVREQEEEEVAKAIDVLRKQRPKTCIALFPRHLHRVGAWAARLDASGVDWVLRSTVEAPVSPGTLVLWDRFGELAAAYGQARAAFVGGSLAPLGGQNFLEPLAEGIVPCIGPHWETFAWVGREIVEQGLVNVVHNGDELGQELVKYLQRPTPQTRVQGRFRDYIAERRGGTAQAWELVRQVVR